MILRKYIFIFLWANLASFVTYAQSWLEDKDKGETLLLIDQDYIKAADFLLKADGKARDELDSLSLWQNSDYWDLQLYLADLFNRLDQSQKALAYYLNLKKVLETAWNQDQDFRYLSLLRELALLQTKLKENQQAEQNLRQLLQLVSLKGDSLDVLYLLVNLYQKERNFEKAENQIRVAAQMLSSGSPNKGELRTFWNAWASLEADQGYYLKVDSLYQNIWASLENDTIPVSPVFLLNWAGIHEKNAKFQQADSLLNILSQKISKTEDAELWANILISRANLCQERAEFKEAYQIYQDLLAESIDQKTEQLQCLYGLSQLYQAQGLYFQADSLLQLILERQSDTIKQADDQLFYAIVLNSKAVIAENLALFEKSDSLFQFSLKYIEKYFGKQHPHYLQILNNYATLKEVQGLYAEAAYFYREVIHRQEQIYPKSHPDLASSYNNLGTLLTHLGRYDRAKILLKKSLNIYEQTLGRTHPGTMNTLHNLAFLEEEQEALDSALFYYHQVLDLERKVLPSQHPQLAASLNNLAWLYTLQGELSTAEKMYLESLFIRRVALGVQHPEYAKSLKNLGILREKQKNVKQADSLYQEAERLLAQSLGQNHPTYTEIIYHQAHFYALFGEYDKAYQKYELLQAQSLNLIQYYLPVLSQAQKESFYLNHLQVYLNAYESFVFFYLDEHPELLNKLWEVHIKTKGLLLYDEASWLESNKILSIEFQKDFEAWKAIRRQLGNLYQRNDIPSSHIDALEEKIAQIEIKLQEENYFANDNLLQAPFTFNEMQDMLKKGEALVEILRVDMSAFFTSKTIWYACLILDKHQSTRVVLLKNGYALEKEYYYDYIRRINRIDFYSYQYFWEPLKKHLKGYQKIFFCPDGVFHLVNLNTLYDTQTQNYLIDQVDLQLIGNVRSLIQKDDLIQINRAIHLLGDPDYQAKNWQIPRLIYTRIEVNDIQKLIQSEDSVQVYLQDQAKEEVVKQISNPYILHLATHGFFSNYFEGEKVYLKNPVLRSGILLANAGKTLFPEKDDAFEDSTALGEDGILTAYEVKDLNLAQTELVVLSACETALGEVHHNEGVFGLQRAFQIAGAKSVLMSLWKVDDIATRQLMVYFYENWQKNGDKSAALRAAQQRLREEYPEPLYWGAFVLLE